jgi:hypothetical protein
MQPQGPRDVTGRVYTEAWMIEGGPPTGAVRPRVFVVSLAALTTCTRAGS